MRWTASVVAMGLAAVTALGAGAWAQTPSMKMMEKDKMDKGMTQDKGAMQDKMMEKKQ